MIDWASRSGLRIIQVLPVNDTSATGTWRDSYPYSSMSVFALHPIYVHLPAITKDAVIRKEIDEHAQKLNALEELDYEAVMKFKMSKLHQIFHKVC